MAPNRIILCRTCAPLTPDEPSRPDMAARLAEMLRAADPDTAGAFTIAFADCMGACSAPIALAFQGEGRASYLFENVSPDRDAGDIMAFCRLYLDAPAGWIEDARPLGRLRHCLRARIPDPASTTG